MLALHKVPRSCAGLARVRGNATVAAAADTVKPTPPPAQPQAAAAPSSASPANAKAPADKGKAAENAAVQPDAKTRGRRVWPTSRPSISLERPRQYMRPIGVGVLPAYDRALELIKKDSRILELELKSLQKELEEAEGKKSPEEIERLREKVKILQVQSQINLPSVRWKARNGLADMSQPVYRHLIEQRWREEGALDLVMQRIHTMSVVPDLLPELHPSLDLRVNYPEAPPQDIKRRTRQKRKYEKIEPGVFLLPEQTLKQPMLYTTVFHPEPRLYTLLMLDLDVPDPANQTFQTYLHWMQPNISLDALSKSPIPLTTSHTPYIPPHPQKGTPYHRYVLLLLPQSNPQERLKVPVPTMEQRLGFDLRAFSNEYGLDGTKGGGVHMWREVWDETVSKIYADVLKTEEPVFGRIPKADPYAELKATPKYAVA